MKSSIAWKAAVVLALIAPVTVVAGALLTVKAVEFRGLNFLSKYEIVRGVETRAVQGGISIDRAALESALEGNGLVAAHRLGIEQERLVITVTERVPAVPVAVVAGERTVPLELDASGRVLSRGAWHARRAPLLVAAAGDFSQALPSARLRGLVSLMERIRVTLPALYREITEVHLGDGELAVYLKGRRTRCTVAARYEGMARLSHVLGYLDRTGRYPDSITVSDAITVIR